MSCKVNQEQLSAWLLGHLSEDYAGKMKNHVASCQRCSHEVSALKESLLYLEPPLEVALPLGLKQRILARAQEMVAPKKTHWLSWQKSLISLAAAVIITVSAVGLWQQAIKAEQAVIQSYAEDFNEFYNYSSDEDEQSNGNGIYGIPSEVIAYLN